MTKIGATAEVFWMAFRALPLRERQEVLARLLADEKTRRDLLDLATIESRKAEPVRSLREYRESSP